MPTTFEWSDPPKRIVDNAEFEEILDALKAAPGEWACVFIQGLESDTASRNVRPRLIDYAARRGITLEAETHKVKGKVHVWAVLHEEGTDENEG